MQQPRQSWIEGVYREYATLMTAFAPEREQGLGGCLVFAGELKAMREDSPADALVAALNVAGAATLLAAPESAAQRRAMRDALVDFVVNSMEEALRIMKNEVRQRRAVSVAVAVSAEYLIEEMLRRGVQPDALPARSALPHTAATNKTTREIALDVAHEARLEIAFDAMRKNGARCLDGSRQGEQRFIAWLREPCCSQKLSREEVAAHAIVRDAARQRWLRLAPRYLGRMEQRKMGVGMSAEEAAAWEQAVSGESAAVCSQRIEACMESGQSKAGF